MEDQGSQEMMKGAGDAFCGSWCRFNPIFMHFFPFHKEIISMRVVITQTMNPQYWGATHGQMQTKLLRQAALLSTVSEQPIQSQP